MDGSDAAIAVYVITGFLGSGKTTLLNHLVNGRDMSDTAVIINEFGEVGIDHALVESSFEDAVLLNNGCLCCTIRGDLLDTLETLIVRRNMGRIPPFRRVVIETTGLADPAPILQSLLSDAVTSRNFQLRGITTLVDAVHGWAQLDDQLESRKQAAIADLLLLSKTDLASDDKAARLVERLKDLNPSAQIAEIRDGQIEPEIIFALNAFDAGLKGGDVQAWLGEELASAHSHDVNRHGDDISAFAITRNAPLPWPAVRRWLQSIASLRGGDVLRIKGILDIEGCAQPVVIHGIQTTLHQPKLLEGWGNEAKSSRVVIIARNLNADGVSAALDKVLAAYLAPI
ncbi:MAG: GTP-binding protein [Rhodospirillales bacterium]|nr:GTP-binding protein [Rhodospirillales bacterium]